MMREKKNKEYTEDQLKQVEFLHKGYLENTRIQENQYKDLNKKIIFLFGFIGVVLTFYSKYNAETNTVLKLFAMTALAAALFMLCVAFNNRKYYLPPNPDIRVAETTYFRRVYDEVAYLKRARAKNGKSLGEVAKWLRWSIWAFTVGLITLAASFIFSTQSVVNFHHESKDPQPRTHRSR